MSDEIVSTTSEVVQPPAPANGQTGKRKADVITIDPDELVLVEDTNSELYDERTAWALDESMVLNIMTYGVIQSVTVRRNGDKLEVVDGRQRVKHAREANKRLRKEGSITHKVPCIVRHDDQVKIMGVMVSANAQRKGDELMTKAAKMQRMLAHGMSIEEVANSHKCTVNTVKNYTLLLDCNKDVQKAVSDGRITADVAKKVAKLPKTEQSAVLEKLMAEGATKGKRAKRALANATGTEDGSAALSKKEQQKLLDALKGTAKATKGSEEVGLAEGIKLLEHVLGLRAKCPFGIVEVMAAASEGEEPKVAKKSAKKGAKGGRKPRGKK